MKKTLTLIIAAIMIAGIVAAIAVAYPGKNGAGATGAPQNKGEMRVYMGELKAHDDRLIVGESENHGKWLEKLDQDRRILAGIAKLKNDCTPCVVMLGPENPPPAFESLEELIIPEIQGADDEPVGDADRELLDRLETKHDENQARHLRNEDKRLSYLIYIEGLIEYYLNPKIECPEQPTCPTCQPGEPGPGPNPIPPEVACLWKICGGEQEANQGAPDPNNPLNATETGSNPSSIQGNPNGSAGQATEGWAGSSGNYQQGAGGPQIIGGPNAH